MHTALRMKESSSYHNRSLGAESLEHRRVRSVRGRSNLSNQPDCYNDSYGSSREGEVGEGSLNWLALPAPRRELHQQGRGNTV